MFSKIETKCLKYPRCLKFVVLGLFLVSLVIFLYHNGFSRNVWRDVLSKKLYANNRPTVINDGSPALETLLKEEGTKSRKKIPLPLPELTYNNISTKNMVIFPSLGEEITPCFINTVLNDSEINVRDYFARPVVDLESTIPKGRSSFLYMNFVFNKILSSMDIKAAVIEPSVLHCLLQPEHKLLLQKRNVTIANFSEKRMTYGILESDVALLEKDDSIHKFRHWGYQPLFIRVPLTDWMLANKTNTNSKTFVSHIFYMYYDWIVHVVVFQKRHNYLWQAAFNPGDKPNHPQKEDFLFTNHDSAYEKFNFELLDLGHSNLASIYIPSNPEHFLFQIPSSRFLECNSSRAENIDKSDNSYRSRLEEFNKKFVPSLKELKTLFNSLLMNFWIFCGTMLGWYRQCGVIPYTTDIDFGAWASEVDDLDYIIKYFLNNKNLTIIERMGMLEEALEFQLRYQRVRVDVFFLYKINNGSWGSGHRPSKGYYFRYHYPPFTLCSAELLGERVSVPCETEDVIIAEYGPKWMTPVKSWGYETSIKNRGPNIYWDEERRKKAFQEY